MNKKIYVNYNENKAIRVGITGVRKINNSYNYYASYNDPIKFNIIKLLNFISKRYKTNKLIINDGGALGFDQLVYSAISDKRYNNTDIEFKFNMFIPFKGQESKWASLDKKRYDEIKIFSDNIIDTSKIDKYNDCNPYIKRNRIIVNNSDIILACSDVNAKTNGTRSTIKFALKHNIPVINIEVSDILKNNMSNIHLLTSK